MFFFYHKSLMGVNFVNQCNGGPEFDLNGGNISCFSFGTEAS